MPTSIQRPLLRREAAAFLTERGYRIAPATLAKLASIGGGPIFNSFGKRALYTAEDLMNWALSRMSGPKRSTSDRAAPRTASDGRRAANDANVADEVTSREEPCHDR